MFIKRFPVLILVILLLQTINLSAKTAYINIENLIKNSKAGNYINSEIKKIQKKQNVEFKNKEDEFKKKEIDILAKKNILDKEAYNKEVSSFQKDIKTYNQYKNKKINELKKKNFDSVGLLMKNISPIITDYASKNNISILLDKKNIIIGANNLDITKDILILLNEKIDKIDIK
mgnify:CR=1 FL=1|jgi:outer membrane protein